MNGAAMPVSHLAEMQARIDAARRENDAASWPEPIDLETLALREPQPPQFILLDWLTVGYACLMSGHGGVGKSALALHLAVCIAMGLRWAGIDCASRRVLYLSCEDREGVLHWRLDRICRYVGVSVAELAGRLDVFDLVGRDCVLWERDPRTGYTVTPAYGHLTCRMQASGAELLIVDGVSDSFGGNENSRTDVKRYVNALLSLVPPDRGALLLLGHVNRPTAANGVSNEGYSGSTAWNNAVRTRLYLYPETSLDDDADRPERTGRLLLELQKSNHGRVDQTIPWRWDDQAHMFLPQQAPSEFDRRHRDREEQRDILVALKACADASITVPAATTGRRTAYHVLAAQPTFPDTLKSKGATRRFWAHVEQLRAMRHVRDDSIRRTTDRHAVAVLALTQDGMRACGQ